MTWLGRLRRSASGLWLLYFSSQLLIFVGFAQVVRSTYLTQLQAQFQEDRMVLADELVTLPLPEQGRVPDLGRDLAAEHQQVQWFDHQGHLLVTVGLPLDTAALLQRRQSVSWQTAPLRLTITRRVLDRGEVVGYLRLISDESDAERELRRLDVGLLTGILGAIALGGLVATVLTRRAQQPLRQSLERLRQFTADASHELRSPLAAIASNAELALMDADQLPPELVRRLQAIEQGSEQMRALVEDLLLLARTDRGVDLQPQSIDLSGLLEDLHPQYDAQVLQRGQQLSWQVAPCLGVNGQPSLLTRLFRNLLDNALRYTPVGGRISLKAEALRGWVRVQVSDTGIGIAPADQTRVFERFWRANPSRQTEGFGLGLAIALQIVREHGGRISLRSQPGQGSCFTVLLPRAEG